MGTGVEVAECRRIREGSWDVHTPSVFTSVCVSVCQSVMFLFERLEDLTEVKFVCQGRRIKVKVCLYCSHAVCRPLKGDVDVIVIALNEATKL